MSVKVEDIFAELKMKVDPAFIKTVDDALKKAGAKIEKAEKGWKSSLKDLAKTGIGALRTGLLGVGVAAGVAFKDALEFDKALAQMTVNSQHALGSSEDLRQKVLGVSDATGLAKEEVLKGASAFVALTGDGKSAGEQMETFAKISQATGSDIEDVAASAAALQQNLNVNPSEFEKAFSILIAGGKKGAVELKDLSSLLANLAPLAAQFEGGTGVRGASQLAASLQLAKQGFGTAKQAATGMQALMSSIVGQATLFKKGGVDVFNKVKGPDGKVTKQLKSLPEVINAIANSSLARDLEALKKAFGSIEAYRAYVQLTKVKGAWEDLTESTLKANDVAEDYAEMQKSGGVQAERAWNNFKNTIAKAFDPERLSRWLDLLGKIVGAASKLVDAIAALDSFIAQGDTEGEREYQRVFSQAIAEGDSWGDASAKAYAAKQAKDIPTGGGAALGAAERAANAVSERYGGQQIFQIDAPITIASPNADPKQVAIEVSKKVNEMFGIKMRDAGADAS